MAIPDPPRGISRLDYEQSITGWNARYMREGVPFSQSFSDAKYGSPEKSLEAAIAWRKEALEIIPPRDRREYAELGKSHNTSGITGVYKTIGHYRVDGTPVYYWVASWCPSKGKRRHRNFSIDKYGEEEAKRLAIEARKTAIANLDAEWPEDAFAMPRRRTIEDDLHRDIWAFEGDEQYRIHRDKERDHKIRLEKINAFLAVHGDLFCEICGFNFEKEYGPMGRGLIEVHHTVPLAEMQPNHRTTLDQLMCICSNCHLAVHNGDPTENLRRLRFIFDAKSKKRRTIACTGAREPGELAVENLSRVPGDA
ncbi:AP2 domain protein [Rubripirellula tenax]|uniref:AP2 domain protein n=1 Tax=Rubripirellula tenax TaxID=2528015 RepID=A0A5C6EBT3_9BACT|nr:AP2 domain-containing protein [Rubripirellula tenax]TWU46190.1 AP2 domain protein [Rubripirellula tenax]